MMSFRDFVSNGRILPDVGTSLVRTNGAGSCIPLWHISIYCFENNCTCYKVCENVSHIELRHM